MSKVRFLGTLIGIILLFAAGCSNERRMLRQQVAAQADSLVQFRGQLQAQSDSLRSASTQLELVRADLDSIGREYDASAHRARQLNSQLKKAEDDLKSTQSSLDQAMARIDSLRGFYSALLADSSAALMNMRSEYAQTSTTLAEKDSLLGKIRPWYMKWRYDAKRGFLKVLFGAGKTKKPDFPEPAF